MTIINDNSQNTFLRIVWGISALLGIWTIFRIISIQSEASSSVLFGLSPSRLVTVFGVLGFIIIFSLLAAGRGKKILRSSRLAVYFQDNRDAFINILLAGSILFSWLGFVNGHNFEKLQEFFIRLLPVVQYLAWVQLLLLVYLVFLKFYDSDIIVPVLRAKWLDLRPAGIILAVLILGWMLVAVTGIGITPGYPYWGESGTNFFGYQFVLAGVIAIIGMVLLKKLVMKRPKQFDLAVFLLLWVLTGIVWNSVELGHNFFAPRAFFQPYYPYSDAAVYDSWSYAILIGEGSTFPGFNSRALYASFLSILHLISGGNYNLLVAIQVFVFALVVPGLYLLGKVFYSRSLGIVVAIIGIFSQINSFASNEFVRVSNTKLLLTEVPTGLILVYAAYFFMTGIKNKRTNQKLLLISFGLLGLTFLLRMHVAVVVVGLLVFLFFLSPKFNVQFHNVFSIAVMVFLIVFPWMVRNYIVNGVFSLDPGRFNILMEERWNPDEEEEPKGEISESSIKVQRLEFADQHERRLGVQFPADGIKEIFAHFTHNQVLAVMSLPQTLRFQTSQYFFENEYYLDMDWHGELPGAVPVYVAANLVILAMGIWAAFRRQGFLGFVPLVIQLTYNGANALVRTSGWRYLTPTEWVPILYFSLGLIQFYSILQTLTQSEVPKIEREPVGSSKIKPLSFPVLFRVGFGFILLSTAISFLPFLVPRQFPRSVRQDIPANLTEIAENTPFNRNELNTFMASENAFLDVGKVLYPRFYFPNKGIFHYRSEIVNYSRMEFTLINQSPWNVRIAVDQPEANLIHGENVLILGCRLYENRIEALVVLGMGEGDDGSLIQRDDLENISCPLETPSGD